MTEEDNSADAPSGNATDSAAADLVVANVSAAHAEKRANEVAMARAVVFIVERRMKRAQSPTPNWFGRPGRSAPPPERPKNWRGPMHGRTFIDARKLCEATITECKAGCLITWGHEFSDDVHDASIAGVSREASEPEARELYGRLQNAIRDAMAFAWESPNARRSPAAIALDALRGSLPDLPPVSELPGYKKSEGDWARFARRWQDNAIQVLRRRLQDRELAELSIVLGVADPPYEEEIARLGKVSAAQMIDWANKRIPKGILLPK